MHFASISPSHPFDTNTFHNQSPQANKEIYFDPKDTMTASSSVSSAKAAFATAVTRGIDALMMKCGYSRERATVTLLRELSRGDSTQPSDEEVRLLFA